jgi:transposase
MALLDLVPSWENRDLRQLLWHRHRMVQTRTRIMNQLQAAALNEALRYEKSCGGKADGSNAPWASRRRRDLLEVLESHQSDHRRVDASD